MWCSEHDNYSNYKSVKWCPLGAFGQECFYTTDNWEEKKYYYISLNMFFLTSGLILMSYITVTFCKTSFKTLISYLWKWNDQLCFLSGTSQCKLHSEHCDIVLYVSVLLLKYLICVLRPPLLTGHFIRYTCSCQYGPKSLRNVSNTLLNLCHEN